MAWKKRLPSVSVDVDVSEFSDEDLLQGLINSGLLHEDEAAAILKRDNGGTSTVLSGEMPQEELEEAMGWINLNRREEALIHIERYLGRYWIGRLAS